MVEDTQKEQAPIQKSIKNGDKNSFLKWIGKSKKKSREEIDKLIDEMRGRTEN